MKYKLIGIIMPFYHDHANGRGSIMYGEACKTMEDNQGCIEKHRCAQLVTEDIKKATEVLIDKMAQIYDASLEAGAMGTSSKPKVDKYDFNVGLCIKEEDCGTKAWVEE